MLWRLCGSQLAHRGVWELLGCVFYELRVPFTTILEATMQLASKKTKKNSDFIIKGEITGNVSNHVTIGTTDTANLPKC